MAEYYSKATILSFLQYGVSPNCMMSPVHIERLLDCIPTVDAEPLVRCKDCRFAKIENNYGFNEVICTNEEFGPRCPVPLDWFCADGEQKKQNHEYNNEVTA